MQNLLMGYVINPKLVHALARIASDFDMAAIDLAVASGADVVGSLRRIHKTLSQRYSGTCIWKRR